MEEREFSPLDQIRRVEAEVTRRIVAAREAAEAAIREAQDEAMRLEEEARLAGRMEGEALLRQTIAKAEAEAHEMVTRAQRQAEEMARKGQSRMKAAVLMAIRLILAWNKEWPEPQIDENSP